jgi:glycosyltransferase involved in cell wall biosynthesis
MSVDTRAIIIPALNEEEALRHLLAKLPREFAQVIVVDNGSTDNTARVAREAGALVVNETQRGYGRACWRGFQAARDLGINLLIFMDGDGSDDPADLPLLLEALHSQEADLVMGSRVTPLAERGAVPLQARLGNWLVSRLIQLLYHVPIHDIGSFRAISVQALEGLQMHEMTFGWPVEMLVKAARANYRIVETPLHYRRRSHGRSKVAGTLSGSIKTAYLMLRTTFRYAWKGGNTCLTLAPTVTPVVQERPRS